MEAFLKKNAGLTKRQISQAKFRPDGITRNGVRCRVTETIYPGDVICVCLEEAGTASAHLENYNDGIRSKDLSDFHSNRASAPVSETSFSLNILYEDTDILAVDKPAGMVTHPTGMHYTDSLSNLVAGYFREKNGDFRDCGFCQKSGSSFKASICKISMQNSQAISCRCIRYFACRYAWCLAYLRFTADAGPGESSENENCC